MKNKQRVLGILFIIAGLTGIGFFQSFEYITTVTSILVLVGMWLVVRSFFILNYTKTEYEDGSIEREIKI